MKLYTTLHDLPLSRFIDCQCNDNFLALIKDPEDELPDIEQLKELWSRLNMQFLELSEDGENNYALLLSLEIQQLTLRHLVITECVNGLENYHIEALVELLKQAGNNFKFDPEDKESYHNDLKRCITRANSLLTQIKDKQAQLDKIQPSDGENEAKNADRSRWDMWLVVLSEFSKYQILEDQITTSRFVLMRNRYIAYCEQLKARENAR